MKKILSLFLALIFIGSAFGLETMGGENLSVSQEIEGNLYTAGGSVNINNMINGDFTSLGGQININGEIKKDLLLIGGNIKVVSPIGEDVRIAGGDILVDSLINGDLVILGGNIHISNKTQINGDLLIFGGNIYLDGQVGGKAIVNGGNLQLNGTINGDAEIKCENITTLENAKILGNLNYKTSNKNQKLEEITQGNKNFTQITKSPHENKLKGHGFNMGFMLYTFIGLFIFGVIFYFVFEKFMLRIGENLQKHFGKSLLFGLIFYAVIPFVALILLISMIGIPFGILLIVIYIFSFVFYKLVNVRVISAWIISKYLGGKDCVLRKKIMTILIISILMTPFVFLDRVISLLTYGAIIMRKSEIINDIVKNG